MLWHFLELILGPRGHGMHIAVLVTHEVQIGDGNRNWLRTDPEKAADIDNDAAALADTMDVVNLPDLVIVCSVDRGSCEHGGSQFINGEADVIAMIHDVSPVVGTKITHGFRSCSEEIQAGGRSGNRMRLMAQFDA
jgi:hypothetical protein